MEVLLMDLLNLIDHRYFTQLPTIDFIFFSQSFCSF